MSQALGVIYLALGRPYLAMALLSAKSMLNHNASVPFTIVTNVCAEPPSVDFFRPGIDKWKHVEVDSISNRLLKTNILAYSEYEKTIFLDCDTVVMGDLSAASCILDYFDVCLRLNRYPQKRKGKGDVKVLDKLTIGELPHWNSGVMLINNTESSRSFFNSWNNKYVEMGSKYDQVALVPTIFETEARILSLEDRWNATDPGFGRRQWRKDTIVYHYATNVCDYLYKRILEFDQIIIDESSVGSTIKFLDDKRKMKKAQMNVVRFFAINILWRFSSPVRL